MLILDFLKLFLCYVGVISLKEEKYLWVSCQERKKSRYEGLKIYIYLRNVYTGCFVKDFPILKFNISSHVKKVSFKQQVTSRVYPEIDFIVYKWVIEI